ncbi:DUF4856 domain-containing protein [Spongiibacter taiwanensis]|uniref:DUF4856 domain-containing protein n=1 Tax=Spongiibacter taiwanensis TaxID=1748242 RepID=UPI002035EBC3|nr:DUF4856 domain-containing protein [Spongiibacter taiwanensis]USA42367.1 DUF4856 domain-containing protein [Spongiibacter taiwanensis]
MHNATDFFKKATLPALILLLSACGGGGGGGSSDDDDNGTPTAPSTYTFESKITAGESAVSYTGQTARQILIEDLVAKLVSLSENPGGSASDIEADLSFYVSGDVDSVNYEYSLDGETLIPGPTYGDISTGKNLSDKIAGGNSTGGGEANMLIGGEFFGWAELSSPSRPIDLVDLFIERVAAEAVDGNDPSITTAGAVSANIGTVTVDAFGRDYRQLIQKFLLGAVTFSQGTNDYLQTDFSDDANHEQDGEAPYTFAEHKWDEAFGYFGAARDYNSYTDAEIAGTEFYKDSDGDGSIDLRSEVNFANSTNCAKRDAGSTTGTNFTKEAFDAFVAGRFLINQASANGGLSAAELEELNGYIETAAKTWEKCIAATVVHYINDVRADMAKFNNGEFADVANFLDLAKHWGEMKGFALGLQFSPNSPFRDGSVDGIDLSDLKELLDTMGVAPVLADGSQAGVAPSGTAQAAIDAYIADLLEIRATLQTAYGFDSQDVANW